MGRLKFVSEVRHERLSLKVSRLNKLVRQLRLQLLELEEYLSPEKPDVDQGEELPDLDVD